MIQGKYSRKDDPAKPMLSRLASAISLTAKALLSAVLLVSSGAAPAAAAFGNVVFAGSITTNGSCVIVVRNDGELALSSNLRQMSSKLVGGVAGSVDIRSNGVYRLSVGTPSVFTVGPSDANIGVTRQVLFSGYDQNSTAFFTERSTPVIATGNLNTRMTIHFIANKTTAFSSGHYEALTVVRCE